MSNYQSKNFEVSELNYFFINAQSFFNNPYQANAIEKRKFLIAMRHIWIAIDASHAAVKSRLSTNPWMSGTCSAFPRSSADETLCQNKTSRVKRLVFWWLRNSKPKQCGRVVRQYFLPRGRIGCPVFQQIE